MKTTRFLSTVLVLSTLLIGALGPSPVRAAEPPDGVLQPSLVDQTGGQRDKLVLTLRAADAARPGEGVELALTAIPLLDAPSLTITWALPPTVDLVSGTVQEQTGPVAANDVAQSSREIRFSEPGIHKVAVEVTYEPYGGVRYTSSGVLFFIVDASDPLVTDMDPNAGAEMDAPVGVSNISRGALAFGPTAVDGKPCFNISGSLTRIDKPITASGYGADVMVPVTDFWVELREADTFFDDKITGTWTDENGEFTFAEFCEGDGLFDNTLELYIWFRAATNAASVTDSSWIDEEYKYKSEEVSSGGGTLSFDLTLNETQSAVFNIMDAAGDALDFWYESAGDNKKMPQVQIHWEPGYGDDGSFYVSFWDEITIADDPSDPDEWDDSVIIHEWGHFADDKRGCDDNPGGQHFFNGTHDPELAFGEGYPDYYQSAVRDWRGDANPGSYVDVPGSGGATVINIETLASNIPNSQRNEIAIAAALWDLHDTTNDNQDTVAHGHAMIQSVYTWNEFTNQNFFDDDCDFENYLRAWTDAGKPADAVTAAAVSQNVTDTSLPPATLRAGALEGQSVAPNAVTATGDAAPEYRWWNRASFVVDNSPSMAGAKLDAVKSALTTQTNAYAEASEGTEFDLQTFNASSSALTTVFEGQFFPSTFGGSISGLTSSGTDNGCTVDGLGAIAAAADGDSRTNLWLYTDGDAVANSPVNAVSQRLTDQGSRGSFVLLGGCTTTTSATSALQAATPLADATTTTLADGATVSEETLANQRLTAQRNSVTALVGPAVLDEPSDGIVPYLLTAFKTGGQFLYVDESQLASAADILEAQLTHKAGAGRWSDYVSDVATYQYDTLASWEFNWIDATDGNAWGKAGDGFATAGLDGSEGRTTVLFSISDPAFDYYGSGQFGAQVYENGYLVIGGTASNEAAVADNTQIPGAAAPNFAVYPFWDDLEWDNRFYADTIGYISPVGYEDYGTIYTKKVGDWHVVQFFGYGLASNVDFGTGNPFQPEEFEVLFNEVTHEIRIQYGDVTGSAAAGATIGIEDAGATDASVQVAYNNPSAVTDNSGYKFVPVPPQPTRTYTVTVDSTMDSVGFLLTGYSGSFDDLIVRDPGGTPVNCADTANVLCLRDLDPTDKTVQYIQVDTGGQTGEWSATVGAGPSGSGTFSFTSFGASPLSPESTGDRTRATADLLDLVVDLGNPADGNTLTGYFKTTAGAAFGSQFTLFDDGAHSDGQAGDGRFGASGFTPPGDGSAYLWMSGELNGNSFVRADPVPYVFQPVSYTSLGDAVNSGGTTTLEFSLRNDDTVEHCYYFNITVPEGWWYDPLDGFFRCVPAGDSIVHTVDVRMTQDTTNDLPSGTSGTVTVAAIEFEKGEISDSAGATVTRRRAPATLDIFSPLREVRPGGATAPLTFYVFDDQGIAVADGTVLTLTTTLGSLPGTATVNDGVGRATFTSGAATGTATLTAETANGVSASTTIEVQASPPDGLVLTASSTALAPDKTTVDLTATVTDTYGAPVAGQLVRIGVEGDGLVGTLLDGSEVITGTTDSNGQVTATFVRVAVVGEAAVRAELLGPDDPSGYRVALEDRQIITLGSQRVFLPLALKQ